jgi:AcrR family transcriptional regulator
MRELAERAALSPATPFNHFGTKIGILAALVERSLEDVAVPNASRACEIHPAQEILEFADHVTSFYADRRDVFAPTLGALVGHVSFDSPALRRATSMWRIGLEGIDAIGELVEGVDRDLLAQHLETAWMGSMLPWCSGNIDGKRWRQQVRFSTAVALSSCTSGRSLDIARAALRTPVR